MRGLILYFVKKQGKINRRTWKNRNGGYYESECEVL